MIKNKQQTTTNNLKNFENKSKPNENLGFVFSSSIKISDPKTGQILLHKRCS